MRHLLALCPNVSTITIAMAIGSVVRIIVVHQCALLQVNKYSVWTGQISPFCLNTYYKVQFIDETFTWENGTSMKLVHISFFHFLDQKHWMYCASVKNFKFNFLRFKYCFKIDNLIAA